MYVMVSIFRKYIIFLLAVIPAIVSGSDNEQGLISNEPLWRQALGGEVLSLPSVQAQSAVVALDGGNIRAYSASGNPMWNYSARGRISPYVTRSREGTSYFARTNGTLFALNRSGRELWRRNLDGPLSAKVITGWDGRLFVPIDKKIYCYTASGTLLWTRNFIDSFAIAPQLDRNGGILLALDNNEVYQIDPFGSAHVWMLQRTPAILISSGIDPQQRQVIVIYTDGTMEQLGTIEDWYISAQIDDYSLSFPRLPSSPVAAVYRENNIAILMIDGRVALFSIDERRILWTGDSHIREMINNRGSPYAEAEMLFDERGIYILSRNGATGFSPDGRRLWLTFLHDAASIPAFGNDGILYSGGRDWILYAYKIEDRILPERNAIYGPVPEGSYGLDRPRIINIFNNEHEVRVKLDQIRTGINTGMVGANEPDWVSFLMMVSSGRYSLQLRISALNLLGRIGSIETIQWLVNIFRYETEPFLRAAAAHAIGDIGVDPQGIAIQNFLYSVSYGGGLRDDRILTAIASATGALCRFSGPPLSETGVRILSILSSGSQSQMVRTQAIRELSSLW